MTMSETVLAQEPWIRGLVFLSVLVAMAIWELAAPRRRHEIPRLLRWSNNIALVVIDTVLVRLMFPVLAVGLVLGGWLGTALAVFAVLPIATGVFGVCPINPLVGQSMRACAVPPQRRAHRV